jgi:alpha-beta hydrolase superfamily lysophospholipase
MAASKPTIVIIHGGWHVPESYEKLMSALRNANYEVHCPRLPSTNLVSSPHFAEKEESDSLTNSLSSPEPTPKRRPLH